MVFEVLVDTSWNLKNTEFVDLLLERHDNRTLKTLEKIVSIINEGCEVGRA